MGHRGIALATRSDINLEREIFRERLQFPKFRLATELFPPVMSPNSKGLEETFYMCEPLLRKLFLIWASPFGNEDNGTWVVALFLNDLLTDDAADAKFFLHCGFLVLPIQRTGFKTAL